jgi:uncharacterized membrane protein YhaH (DUF805 family)
MNWVNLFFSSSGRANRLKYWVVAAAWLVFGWLVEFIWIVSGASQIRFGQNHLVDFLGLAVIAPGVYSLIAVGIKRLHDRNKSGWWVLVFYFCPAAVEMIVPVAESLDSTLTIGLFADTLNSIFIFVSVGISIWMLVELGCLRGTLGPNKYGPDPLDG